MSPPERAAAVVAGGSAGIGRAVARDLARRGWKVAVLARGESRLRAAEAELSELGPASDGPNALGLVCDVGDAAAVEAAAERAEAELGPLTVWVNSAMLTAYSRFHELAPENFERIVAATLIGQANGVRAALKRMRARGRPARIVCIGSGLGYRSIPLQSAYCAAKHGVNGLAASVRCELLAERSPVTISLVQLPGVNTPQFTWAENKMDEMPQPAPPVYAPEVAARGVMRAVDGGAREILVGRPVLQLIGGQLLFPDRLDRKLARDGFRMQKSGEPDPEDRPDNLAGPVDLDVAADGRYGDMAEGGGWIVDGDRARLGLIALIGGAGFLLGLLAG